MASSIVLSTHLPSILQIILEQITDLWDPIGVTVAILMVSTVTIAIGGIVTAVAFEVCQDNVFWVIFTAVIRQIKSFVLVPCPTF